MEQMIVFICNQVNLVELSLPENDFSLQTTTTVLAMLAKSPNTVIIQRLNLRDSAKYSQEADEDRTLEAFIENAPHLLFSLLRPSTANLMYEGVVEYLRSWIASEERQRISVGTVCDASNLAELWSRGPQNFELVIDLICNSREPCANLNFSGNFLNSE